MCGAGKVLDRWLELLLLNLGVRVSLFVCLFLLLCNLAGLHYSGRTTGVQGRRGFAAGLAFSLKRSLCCSGARRVVSNS